MTAWHDELPGDASAGSAGTSSATRSARSSSTQLRRDGSAPAPTATTASAPPEPSAAAGVGASEDTRLLARVGAATVLLVSSETTRLRDLWAGQPTVVAFIRQFGCLFCHELVSALAGNASRIREKNARLVIVGNGSMAQAQAFFAEKGLPVSGVVVATDPSRESYRAAELERGVVKTFFNAGSRDAYVRARRQGFAITGAFGDTFQLGGLLVVRPGSHLAYRHVSKFAGDHPAIDDVIAALG